MSEFNQIASAITNSPVWYAAVQEAKATLHREQPGGVHCDTIGHYAWRQLTPIEQAHALNDLFTAYILQLNDEERAAKLATADATVKTYLEGDEEYCLHSALDKVRPVTDDTAVDGVPAFALANVLDELDLLRHRLAMANQRRRGQWPVPNSVNLDTADSDGER